MDSLARLKKGKEKVRQGRHERLLVNMPFLISIKTFQKALGVSCPFFVNWNERTRVFTVSYPTTVTQFYASRNKCRVTQGNVLAKTVDMTGEEFAAMIHKGEMEVRKVLK
jgi:hypothetical protein